jgi:hypothetical protein
LPALRDSVTTASKWERHNEVGKRRVRKELFASLQRDPELTAKAHSMRKNPSRRSASAVPGRFVSSAGRFRSRVR